jgi:hypothetical protein
MKILSYIDKWCDRCFAILGAFAGSQIPAFMHQYTQRLAGHVDELTLLVKNLNQLASAAHKTLEQYIQKFTSTNDPDFVQQGEFMYGVITRWNDLSQILSQLAQSSLWERPFIFFKNIQYDIAQPTLASFQMSITMNVEGFIYMAIGALVSVEIYQFFTFCLTRLYKRGYSVISNLFKKSDYLNSTT